MIWDSHDGEYDRTVFEMWRRVVLKIGTDVSE
jgi:hypothetical protein